MSKPLVPDELWTVVEPLIPPEPPKPKGGLPRAIRVHDLRHAATTLMLASEVHPKVASEPLGHSTVTITLDLYTHAVKGLDADAAERMQAAIRKAARA
jgi:integrase